MDVFAFLGAGIGLMLGAKGFVSSGSIVYAVSLIALPVGLTRERRWPTLLPFSFATHWVALGLLFVVMALGYRSPPLVAVLLALVVYNFLCVTLVERKARYTPRAHIMWKVVSEEDDPDVYRRRMLFLAMCTAVVCAIAFSLVSGIQIPGPWLGPGHSADLR
jgi:hypothetical protein